MSKKVNRMVCVSSDVNDAMKNEKDVNWSAIAEAAFAKTLALRGRLKSRDEQVIYQVRRELMALSESLREVWPG